MKTILITLLSFLLVSCGSRKKNLEIQKQETEISAGQNLSKTETTETKSESKSDLSKLFESQDFKIVSDGNPYKIDFNGFKYEGSGSVEISNKKENTTTKTITKTETKYRVQTAYKSHTTYKTVFNKKNFEVESKRPMFWLYFFIVIASICLWEAVKSRIKIL